MPFPYVTLIRKNISLFLISNPKSQDSNLISFRQAQATEDTNPDEVVSEADNTHTELSILEKDCCKQNFQFYDKAKQGFVERFELPMVLTSKYP